MAKEIERKFLVINNSFLNIACKSIDMQQGYVCTDPDHTVRVRIAANKAFLTIKTRNKGCMRNEWEFEIDVTEAQEILATCQDSLITKTRYIVPVENGLKWEIDVFHGRHQGLIVAEIELPAEDTPFTLPAFIGKEVTGDPAYYNSSLSKG